MQVNKFSFQINYMIIIGAGGYAKELLEIFHQKGETKDLAFYDDINPYDGKLLFDRYRILRNEIEVKDFFRNKDNKFIIGIGNPQLRRKLCERFIALGGELASLISPRANIGSYEVQIGAGTNIMDGAVFSNCTETGIGCIIYYNVAITHDCKLGNFVQVSPGVSVLGSVFIDDFVMIGGNATILPKIRIGKSSVIAAGAVITKSVPDYALMVGNPAKQSAWISEYGDKLIFGDDGVATCQISGVKYRQQNQIVEKVI
jgi:sugar O-acyltransferase (sialic acid O-acetyltransferase NeuD family)